MNYEEDRYCLLWLGPPFNEAYEMAVFQIYLYPKSSYEQILEPYPGAKVTEYGPTNNGYHKKLYEMIEMNSDGSISAEKIYDGFIDDGQHFVYVMIIIPAGSPEGIINYLPYFFNSFKFNPVFTSQAERCGVKETVTEKDNCYMAEAYGSIDSAICDKISDQSMVWVDDKINRSGCLYFVGMRKRDPSICELAKANLEVYTQCKNDLNQTR